jgi:tRNA dimethylallyltransferase
MILILGTTASGKGSLAFDLARRIDAEIISIDSMKVYRRMDIGTAKPSLERRTLLPYHLIDVVDPSDSFSVDQFLDHTHRAVADITSRGKSVVAVGGTAMYIKALLYGIFEGPGADPEIRKQLKKDIHLHGSAPLHNRLTAIDPAAAARIHPNDHRRLIRALEVHELTGKPISSFQNQFTADRPSDDWTIIGLRRPKPIESSRINARVKKMISDGLVDEVQSLLAEDRPLSKQAAAAIGYAEIIYHLQNDTPLDDAIEQIKINTRKLAKAQRTWFKTFTGVSWIDISPDDTPQSILDRTLRIVSP